LRKKAHKIENKLNHVYEKIQHTFAEPPHAPEMQMPEFELQFEMPQFSMPQFDFGMQQQSIWGQPPMAQFAMPEWNRQPMGFGLF